MRKIATIILVVSLWCLPAFGFFGGGEGGGDAGDISGKLDKATFDTYTGSHLSVTADEKATWNGKQDAITSSTDLTVKSLTVAKQSGSAGINTRYEANSTDTDYVGEIGPASMTANTSYLLRDPAARATAANQVRACTNAGETGTGTPADPYIQACAWVTPLLTSALGTGVETFLGTPSSANLAAALTDETGSGVVVFSTAPDISAPRLVITTTGLTADNVYYMTSGGSWAQADANGSGTYPGRCYAVSTTQCMFSGVYTKSSHGFTIGADLYLSETAGAVTTTAPTTSASIVQKIGWVLDANTIVIAPSPDYLTVK